MKLTGILKTKVEEAETLEEKKNLIEEAGMELTDDEVESVVGGGTALPTIPQLRTNAGYKPISNK